MVKNVGLVYEAIAKENGLNQYVGQIKDFMAEAHNIRQEVANLKTAVSDIENYAKGIARDANSNLKMLQNQIQSQMNIDRGSFKNEFSNLVSQVNSLQSKINNLISSGNDGGGDGGKRSDSSGSGVVSVSKYNEKVRKIDRLSEVIEKLINAVQSGETNLKSYISQINSVLRS